MSDSDLLISLGLDPDDYRSERTQGVDGFSMSYVTDEQEVRITRSIVSGVVVMAQGSKVTGHWKLGGDGT